MIIVRAGLPNFTRVEIEGTDVGVDLPNGMMMLDTLHALKPFMEQLAQLVPVEPFMEQLAQFVPVEVTVEAPADEAPVDEEPPPPRKSRAPKGDA